MRLYLINPSNSLVSIDVKKSFWNKYRVWKPLNLLIIAGLTPSDWDITIIDENISTPDYENLKPPDLVGLTTFTSQANRAYEIADYFRKRNIPVVMGGIHATMCTEEALNYVDCVVKGEAEGIWGNVLEDFKKGCLEKVYECERQPMDNMPIARHDLLPDGAYFFGAIQTTRGCPLNCTFCSVSSFNGKKYRRRPIEDVIEEFKIIKEKHILIVDDNLIGTSSDHIANAKKLFRAIIDAKIKKRIIAQVTINMADDVELMKLAVKAGCFGVFIGFESPHHAGLKEIKKVFNLHKDRNLKESVKRMHKYGLSVVGSFIIGLDIDEPGIGRKIAETASHYKIDILNSMMLTPLPGTDLWNNFHAQNRIAVNKYPDDWKYFTLTYPVAKYKNLTQLEMIDEEENCSRIFYSKTNILYKLLKNFILWRNPIATLLTSLSYRSNAIQFAKDIKNCSLVTKNIDN